MRGWIAAAAMVALTGCATQAKFKEGMDSWLGSTEGNLVSTLGPPMSVYPTGDGGKILSYSRGGNMQMPGSLNSTTRVYGNTAYTQTNVMPGANIQLWCNVNFTLDSRGIVQQWNSNGNHCVSR